MKQRKGNVQNVAIVFVFVIAFIILFWRSFIGFQWNDEAFYAESAYRFLQGDNFFRHEWNTTQLSASLIMPWVAAYRFFTGGKEGIILFCRLGYLFLSGIISIWAYIVLSVRKGKWTALSISMIYLFYAKQSVATFSYNTLAISFAFCALLIVYKMIIDNNPSVMQGTIVGIFYSMSVIANPFLAGLIIIYTIFYILLSIFRKPSNISKQLAKGIILGILFSVIYFFTVFYKQNILKNLIQNLNNMIMVTDVDRRSFLRKIGSMFFSVMRLYKYTFILYILSVCYLCMKKIKKKVVSIKEEKVIVLVESMILFVNIICSLQNRLFCGVSFIAFGMYGVVFILLRKKSCIKELIVWFVPGFILTMLFFMASNTGEVAIAAGCFFTAVGTILILKDYLHEQSMQSYANMYRNILTIVTSFMILSILYARVFFVFRQPAISYLTEQIEVGPCKGLYVTEEGKKEYTDLYDTIMKYTSKNDTVLISKLASWAYLATDARCGAYSTWLINMNNEFLADYYSLNMEKIPNVVIQINDTYGYINDNNPAEGYLYENLITKRNYEKIECTAATIYRAKSSKK